MELAAVVGLVILANVPLAASGMIFRFSLLQYLS
jgi:hypothetical protein